VVVAVVLVLRQLVDKARAGVAWGLRDDDFWAFSGGHLRRGLLGEILYRGTDLVGERWLAVVSAGLVVIYGFAVWRVARIMQREASWRWLWPVGLSAVFLNFPVDREAALLLPLLMVGSWTESGALRRVAFLLAVIAAAFVHEFAVLLYLPLVLMLLAEEPPGPQRHLLLAGAGAIVLTGGLIAVLRPVPSIVLETTFWPTHGMPGLEATHLYSFVSRSLGDTMRLHFSMLATPSGLWNLAFQATLLALLVSCLWGSWRMLAAVLCFVLPASVLTIDYGRYAYMTFFFYFLAWYQLGFARKSRVPSPRHRRLICSVAVLFCLIPHSFFAGAEPVELAVERSAKRVWGAMPKLARLARIGS